MRWLLPRSALVWLPALLFATYTDASGVGQGQQVVLGRAFGPYKEHLARVVTVESVDMAHPDRDRPRYEAYRDVCLQALSGPLEMTISGQAPVVSQGRHQRIAAAEREAFQVEGKRANYQRMLDARERMMTRAMQRLLTEIAREQPLAIRHLTLDQLDEPLIGWITRQLTGRRELASYQDYELVDGFSMVAAGYERSWSSVRPPLFLLLTLAQNPGLSGLLGPGDDRFFYRHFAISATAQGPNAWLVQPGKKPPTARALMPIVDRQVAVLLADAYADWRDLREELDPLDGLITLGDKKQPFQLGELSLPKDAQLVLTGSPDRTIEVLERLSSDAVLVDHPELTIEQAILGHLARSVATRAIAMRHAGIAQDYKGASPYRLFPGQHRLASDLLNRHMRNQIRRILLQDEALQPRGREIVTSIMQQLGYGAVFEEADTVHLRHRRNREASSYYVHKGEHYEDTSGHLPLAAAIVHTHMKATDEIIAELE